MPSRHESVEGAEAQTAMVPWPDRRAFWRDKRVIVTGGSGFLGSFVVGKLKELEPAEVIVPRSHVYDLRQCESLST